MTNASSTELAAASFSRSRTDDFAAEFERRRGYAIRPFLPLLLQPGWRNCFQARVGAPLFDDAAAGRGPVRELMVRIFNAIGARSPEADDVKGVTETYPKNKDPGVCPAPGTGAQSTGCSSTAGSAPISGAGLIAVWMLFLGALAMLLRKGRGLLR